MDAILLIARLVLFVVFALAGIAKLLDLPGSRRAIRDFGIAPSLASPLGTLLPFVELAVALSLLPLATAWWGAAGALILLLVFIVGIGFNLARGRQPDCQCFGQLHSAPVSWRTLARNGLLALIAGLIIWQGRDHPGASIEAWLASLSAADIISLIVAMIAFGAALIEGWFLLHLLQQQGRLLLRIEALENRLVGNNTPLPPQRTPSASGLAVGTPAPNFQLPDLAGVTHTLTSLLSESKSLILIFSDPGCGPCTALMPEVARWQQDYASELTIAIVSRGTVEVNRMKNANHGLTHLLLQKNREVAQAYQSHGTPSAVLIRPDRKIGSFLAIGADEIQELVKTTASAPQPVTTWSVD